MVVGKPDDDTYVYIIDKSIYKNIFLLTGGNELIRLFWKRLLDARARGECEIILKTAEETITEVKQDFMKKIPAKKFKKIEHIVDMLADMTERQLVGGDKKIPQDDAIVTIYNAMKPFYSKLCILTSKEREKYKGLSVIYPSTVELFVRVIETIL